MVSLSWTESSLPAKTTARRAPSGVPKVHAGQWSGAKRCWCSTGGALSRPATPPPRRGRPGCCCWPSVEAAALAPPARWNWSLVMRPTREIGGGAPSASSSTAALQRCAHGHAVLAGLPARVCRRRERLGWRQSLVLGAFESSRCVHHSHGHREGACKPKIFRKLATNEGSRESVGGDSTSIQCSSCKVVKNSRRASQP